ncbi:MAG: hypothetical protein AAGD07_02475 [Planctomycetota bacterium]
MSHDEALVGVLAMMTALLSGSVCIGPWSGPYRLRTIASIETRFGKPYARACWGLIAIVAATCGVSILSGLRPSYAAPQSDVAIHR